MAPNIPSVTPTMSLCSPPAGEGCLRRNSALPPTARRTVPPTATTASVKVLQWLSSDSDMCVELRGGALTRVTTPLRPAVK